MSIPRLDKRVTIETSTAAVDAVGEPVQTWALFAVVWAALRPMTGNERIQAQQVESSADSVITIRYLAGVVSTMRIKYGSRTFQILWVQNVNERNMWLELRCAEQL